MKYLVMVAIHPEYEAIPFIKPCMNNWIHLKATDHLL